MNHIEEYAIQKGYSLHEIRTSKGIANRPVTQIPDNLKDKYNNIEEYFADVHDYINGL
jgi:hypothetical protein